LRARIPQMLSGHVQGLFLQLFSQALRPDTILEIGTFTGYSAICLAKGLAEGGILHTIDNDPEVEAMARDYFQKAGLQNQIRLHIGDALEIIGRLNGPLDLIFIDADKTQYASYYDHVFDKTPPGGFILADNVLWSGRVLQADKDEDTAAIHALTVRDGLMVIRKK